MKILIKSTSDDVRQLLEPLGALVEPANIDHDYNPNNYEYYYLEIENIEELFHISKIVSYPFIIDHIYDTDIPYVEIYNDYRE